MNKKLDDLAEIYDGFAEGYDTHRDEFNNRGQLEMLAAHIPEGASVLDAGCGSGYPVLRFFADRGCRVTGTDICPAMLELAAQRVPEAVLMEADSAMLDFPEASFDLIVSFYSMFHLPMEQQERAFSAFARILKPDGTVYCTLACAEYTGVPEFSGTREFAGVELPYHHVTPGAYRDLFSRVGLQTEQLDLLTIGGETMSWALLKKIGDI